MYDVYGVTVNMIYRISLIRTRTQIQRALEYKTTKAS